MAFRSMKISGRLLGILLVLLVVLLWVGASFLMRYVFISQQFNKPFFVTYLNTGTFALYLPIYMLSRRRKRYGRRSLSNVGEEPAVAETIPIATDLQDLPQETNENDFESQGGSSKSCSEVVILSAQFCVLWFLANYTTNASLSLTNVASTTILSSSSSFWTLLISSCVGLESFGFVKFISVLLRLV